jgi:hypothetical protein
MAVGFVEMDRTNFYYELAGEGEPLVFVHAGIADSRMWDDQFHPFAQSYRVLRYDRRGFGRSPMVAGPYSHHGDLYALLRFLGIEKAPWSAVRRAKRSLTFAPGAHRNDFASLDAGAGWIEHSEAKPWRNWTSLKAGDIGWSTSLTLGRWMVRIVSRMVDIGAGP